MLTVILPAYNEEEMVACAAEAISQILMEEDIPYEILFIDDGSTDGTWAGIMNLSNEKEAVRGISFSRNFGKEAAVAAGLAEARGDCAVVLDCDLQHPPEKATLERRQPWLQALPKHAGTAPWSSTATCSIRPKKSWRCTGSGSRATKS